MGKIGNMCDTCDLTYFDNSNLDCANCNTGCELCDNAVTC